MINRNQPGRSPASGERLKINSENEESKDENLHHEHES